jgi:hypothetical protein
VVRTLDDILHSEHVERVDVIKVDTDGAEPAVLRGAERTLLRDRPSIIVELFGEGLRRRGATAGTVADLLEGAGYELFIPDLEAVRRWRARPPRMRRLNRTTAAVLAADPPATANVLAIHRDRDDHRRALQLSRVTGG